MARRVRDTATEDQIALDLTPMLDVVFIMLIFFVVTAVFVREPGVEVNKPFASSSSAVKPTILVAITDDDEIWINRQVISEAELLPTLESLRAENPKAEAIVQGDRQARFETTYRVMSALREAGIEIQTVAAER